MQSFQEHRCLEIFFLKASHDKSWFCYTQDCHHLHEFTVAIFLFNSITDNFNKNYGKIKGVSLGETSDGWISRINGAKFLTTAAPC